MVAGGVESMSRAPLVMPKADSAFSRKAEIYDTTIGWRFINPKLQQMYGTDSMPETAENVAKEQGIIKEEQDKITALRYQQYQEAINEKFHKKYMITPCIVLSSNALFLNIYF